MNVPYRTCRCCGLPQPSAADVTGVTAAVCQACAHHQGDQDAKRLSRAETHERMLRDRLAKCRQSETEAQAERARAREAVASALTSRGHLAARVIDAVDNGGR